MNRVSGKNHVFTGSPLDRAAHHRRDAGWISARLGDPSTRILPMWRLKPLITPGAQPSIAWLSPGQTGETVAAGTSVFLGFDDGIAHFAADATDLSESEPPYPQLGKFIDLRTIAPQLPGTEPAILAQARSLIDWHARHRFCARCGEATTAVDAGHARQCVSEVCGDQHFPRTDPVVIMLVVSGQRCLLGRSARFPVGFYSALAGFVEVGETIEEAVRREVREEVGVDIGDVSYHSSQPWPFPSSLMIGCFAEALSEEIVVDPVEIEDARWVSREAIRDILAGADGEVQLPPPMAIARQLIEAWAGEVA